MVLLTLVSCVPEKKNAYLFTGNDFARNNNQNIIGCEYDSLDFNVIDKIIKVFGNNYKYKKDDFEESYIWNNLIFNEFDDKPLNVVIERRIENIKSLDGKIHEFESISLKIEKNKNDFFHPLKIGNRQRAKRFLVNVIET